MDSSLIIHHVEINDEITKMNVYDDNGYLPIHRATFGGHEIIVKSILEDAEQHDELTHQLEAITRDVDEFTPLLLATAVGRLEIIDCLLEYPVNLKAIDAVGHGKYKERDVEFSFS
jgi:ankyrin repeat protein